MKDSQKYKWVLIFPGAAIVILFFLFAPFLFRTFLFQAYKMPSGSMKPTLMVGDLFFADKSFKGMDIVDKGDVLIFEYPKDPSKIFTKRVIGLPGDSILIRDKKLYINQALSKENYVIHTHDGFFAANENNRDNYGPVVIPKDSFFMLGDNRDESNDSRFWGFLKSSGVRGKATFIYWSWDSTRYRIRWNRIGKTIH